MGVLGSTDCAATVRITYALYWESVRRKEECDPAHCREFALCVVLHTVMCSSTMLLEK